MPPMALAEAQVVILYFFGIKYSFCIAYSCLCFTFVGNSTVNTGFCNFAGFLGLFSIKLHQISSKSYKMTFACKGQCVKRL